MKLKKKNYSDTDEKSSYKTNTHNNYGPQIKYHEILPVILCK